MNTLGIYIFNQTRGQWFQFDERSWGSFSDATEFTPGNEEYAEEIRLRETKGNETTFVMAALH